jgi:hypothetical protein
MKHKRVKLSVLLLGLGLTAQAQQATLSSGGMATGSGSVAYSIGQIAYTTATNASGSITQGVQQPIEIYTLGVDDFVNISLIMKAYPNPTQGDLTLEITDLKLENLTFQLIDLQGRSIENRKIANTNEIIKMENLPSATYFLKVTNNNKEVKSFKIIKN